MIKIIGNDITRGGEKIGWIEGNDIYDENGTKLGYFMNEDIYSAQGTKLGYIARNSLHANDGETLDLDNMRREITGGSYPDLTRAAIYLLLGD